MLCRHSFLITEIKHIIGTFNFVSVSSNISTLEDFINANFVVKKGTALAETETNILETLTKLDSILKFREISFDK